MDELKISPDFTIDDIHKIREYHHSQTKDMSTDEMKAFYKSRADSVVDSIEKKRLYKLSQ